MRNVSTNTCKLHICTHKINDDVILYGMQADEYKSGKILHTAYYAWLLRRKIIEMLFKNSLHLILNIVGIVFYIHRGK